MAATGNAATNRVVEMLTAPTGLPFTVAALSEYENVALAQISAENVVAQNVSVELAERGAGIKYPVFYVYCEGVANLLKEKFRTFSGKAYMAVEVRVSLDRLEGLGRELELYTSGVTDVLDSHRGQWGSRNVLHGRVQGRVWARQAGRKEPSSNGQDSVRSRSEPVREAVRRQRSARNAM